MQNRSKARLLSLGEVRSSRFLPKVNSHRVLLPSLLRLMLLSAAPSPFGTNGQQLKPNVGQPSLHQASTGHPLLASVAPPEAL